MPSFTLLAGLSLVILSIFYLVKVVIKNNRKQRLFESMNPKFPVAPDINPLVGHLFNVHSHAYSSLVIHDLHAELGPTFEFLTSDSINIATTDLDLIKKINLDEPFDHLNRHQLSIPISEIRENSPSCAPKHQWLRIRKAIAPAFS